MVTFKLKTECQEEAGNIQIEGRGCRQQEQQVINQTLHKTQKERIKGFPGGTMVKNPPAMQETQEMWVRSLG